MKLHAKNKFMYRGTMFRKFLYSLKPELPGPYIFLKKTPRNYRQALRAAHPLCLSPLRRSHYAALSPPCCSLPFVPLLPALSLPTAGGALWRSSGAAHRGSSPSPTGSSPSPRYKLEVAPEHGTGNQCRRCPSPRHEVAGLFLSSSAARFHGGGGINVTAGLRLSMAAATAGISRTSAAAVATTARSPAQGRPFAPSSFPKLFYPCCSVLLGSCYLLSWLP
jgi:hypothetical protein